MGSINPPKPQALEYCLDMLEQIAGLLDAQPGERRLADDIRSACRRRESRDLPWPPVKSTKQVRFSKSSAPLR
jgi:hypothetical protein